MSSLHFRGDFIKFAVNNHRLPSASGRFDCALTGYIAAPQRYLAVYLLIKILHFGRMRLTLNLSSRRERGNVRIEQGTAIC